MTDTTQQQREAREIFRLASHWADLRVKDICNKEDTPEKRKAEDALFAACMARATPQGAEPVAEGKADAWEGRIIELCYETHRAIVRYEGEHPCIGADVFLHPPEPKLSELQADAKDAARYREVLRTGVPYSKDVCFTDEQIGQFLDQRIAERATPARQEGSAT